mgnify:CR=1 FL=1
MKIKNCEFCKIIGIKLSDKYHNHHIDGNGIGETIILCTWHHNNIHGYIKKKSILIALKINPTLFAKTDLFFKIIFLEKLPEE